MVLNIILIFIITFIGVGILILIFLFLLEWTNRVIVTELEKRLREPPK